MRFATLVKKASEGDARAQYDLAYAYEYGEGVEENEEEALKWYTALSDQGYREGYRGVAGILIRKGHKAKNRAALLEAKSRITDGSVGADLYNQALEAEDGELYQRAIELYKESGKAECAAAYYKLAMYHGAGLCVEYDFIQEMSCLITAAEAGLPAAMFRLAICYEQGDNGETVDIDKAIYWYTRAIESGEPNAKGRLKRAEKKRAEILEGTCEDEC